jgi:serine/threonine-protein kinase haspin
VNDITAPNKTVPLHPLTHTLNLAESTSRTSTAKVHMDDPSHGVRATIIDLGLSRMNAGDGDSEYVVHWTPFDEEVFMGEGRPFPTYHF